MTTTRTIRWSRLGLSVALLVGGLAAAGCSSGSTSSTTTTTTAAVTTTTSSAATAAKIKAIQGNLAAVGCYYGKVDGIAGKGTAAAITAFQKAAGLKADGIYGPNTEGQLLAAATAHRKVCGSTPPTTIPATTTTAAGAMAACTKPAIQAALPAGETVVDVQCARGWAAGAMKNSQYDSAFLLRSANGVWVQPPTDACTNASYNIPNVILNVSPCRVQ